MPTELRKEGKISRDGNSPPILYLQRATRNLTPAFAAVADKRDIVLLETDLADRVDQADAG